MIKFLAIEQKSGILSVEIPKYTYSYKNSQILTKLDYSEGKHPTNNSSSRLSFHHVSIYFLGGKITYALSKNRDNLIRLKDYLQYYQLQLTIEEYLAECPNYEDSKLQEYNCLVWLLQKKYLQPLQFKSIFLKLIEETIFEIFLCQPGTVTFQVDHHFYPVLPNKSTMKIIYQLEGKIRQWKQFTPYILFPQQRLKLQDKAYLQNCVSSTTYKCFISWTDRQKSLLELSRQLNCSLIYLGKALYPYIQKGLLTLESED